MKNSKKIVRTALLTLGMTASAVVPFSLYNNEIENNSIVSFEEVNSNDEYESISTYNNVNIDDSPYIGTPYVNDGNFSWYDATTDSIKFSFFMILEGTQEGWDAGTLEDGIIRFVAAEDLVLLYDENADGVFTASEGHQFGIDDPNFTYLGSSNNSASSFDPVSFDYQINGLEDGKEYTGFSLYFKTDESQWAQDEEAGIMTDDTVIDEEYDKTYSFEFDESAAANSFYTHHDATFYIIIAIIILIIILIIVAIFLGIRFIIWWHKHMSLSLYFDEVRSLEEKELILNLLHVKRYHAFWDAHEEDLILLANGRAVDAVFQKSPNVPGGYRVYITDDTNNKEVMNAIMSATKFDTWHIGVRNHEEEKHAFILSDDKAKKIIRMISKSDKKINDETKDQMLEEMVNKISAHNVKRSHGVISHISDKKSTSTTLRFQVMYPEHHILFDSFDHDGQVDDPQKKTFYYIYNGKAYEMDYKFVGKYGHLYEYDFINLQPGTIYAGISVSLDGGKTIAPSAAIYGITKDESGIVPTKSHAKIAKPKNKSVKSHELWTEREALEYLGEDLMHRTFDILTKKHYEEENPEFSLSADRASEYYDEYIDRWFEDDDDKYMIEEGTPEDQLIKIEDVTISQMTSAEKLAGRAFAPKLIEKKATAKKTTSSVAKETTKKEE